MDGSSPSDPAVTEKPTPPPFVTFDSGQRLFNRFHDLLLVLRGSTIAFANGAIERALGYPAAGLVDSPVEQLFVEPASAEAQALMHAATGTPTPVETRWRMADGGELWVELAVQPMTTEEGLRVLLGRDVSERVRARNALAESEQRFRSVVSSVQGFVVTLSLDGRITGLYGAGASSAPDAQRTIIGKSAEDLFPPDVARSHVDACAQARTGVPVTYECVFTGPDGPKDLEITLSPMRDVSGRVNGLVGVAHFTTEKKQLQAELLVADRMASVGTLAAGVAHEINNPLAAAIVTFDMVAETLSSLQRLVGGRSALDAQELRSMQEALAAADEMIRDGVKASERIRKIVADLKHFSRASGDEQVRPLDVGEVLESTLRVADNEIRHRARLNRELNPVPKVNADAARLGQVFLNLLVNAAHAIPEGASETNEISVSTSLAADGRVAIEFRDTGVGISPEVMQRLFTPFFTTRATRGRGLGLSVSHRIVARLGGELQVTSLLGKGSTFRVLLPAVAAAPGVATGRSRGRVLVIDDDLLVSAAIARGLSDAHDIDVRGSARHALALLQSGHQYDVILLDLMMPDMTGMQFLDELAAQVPAQVGAVVMLTGGVLTEDTRAVLEARRVPVIEKPISLARLRALTAQRLHHQAVK